MKTIREYITSIAYPIFPVMRPEEWREQATKYRAIARTLWILFVLTWIGILYYLPIFN